MYSVPRSIPRTAEAAEAVDVNRRRARIVRGNVESEAKRRRPGGSIVPVNKEVNGGRVGCITRTEKEIGGML